MTTYAPPKLRHTLAEAAFRRKSTLLLTLYAVGGLVLLTVALLPAKYRATAKLLVQNVRSQAPLTTSPVDRTMQNTEVSPTEVNSEVDLLGSVPVARRALGQNPASAESRDDEKAVKQLKRRLTVEAVHQTDNIDVELTGKSPEAARQQLSSLLNAYFEERAAAARSGGAAEFFDRQVQAKGRLLDADQQALTAFEMQHGIADLEDQKKLQVARIGGIEDQLRATQAGLAQQRSKTAAERRELALTPSRSRTIERSITNQYSQERLNTSLVDLQNQRSELLKRYPPTERQVVALNEKIATTQKAIVDARSSPAGETATDVNPVWQTLNAAVATSSGDLSGLAAQAGELERQRKAAEARLDELEQATTSFNALQRKVSQSQADYTAYAQKRDESRIAEALDREKMFDVALVEAPNASPESIRPKWLYLLAGLVFALLLGLLLAIYRDTSSEHVYTPAQLDARTGTRTLAVLADDGEAERFGESNRVQYRRLLFAIRSALGQSELGAAPLTQGSCVAFTSAIKDEGVSTVVSHLATEAALQASSKVAVIDAAGLLRRFEAEGALSFAMRFNEAKRHWAMAKGDAAGMGAMRHGGTQGLFSTRLRPLLDQARNEFDLILIDCPSSAESTLAGELAGCVDGYVVVVGAGRARRQNLEDVQAVLKDVGTPLLGYVLNRRRYPVPRWLHRLLW